MTLEFEPDEADDIAEQVEPATAGAQWSTTDALLEFDRAAWREDAACRGANTDLFYSLAPADIATAADICSACPVRDECRAYGKTVSNGYGVWGGELAEPRPFSRPLAPIRHGTPGGYMKHIRRGLPACVDCRRAHSNTVQGSKSEAYKISRRKVPA